MKVGFQTAACVENRSAERPPLWLRVVKPLVYYSARLGREITVPVDFHTDGRSSPRLLWNLVPPVGICLEPAIVHDYLYKTAVTSRREADAVFSEALKAAGFPAWRAWVNWVGLRLGGWRAWGIHREFERACSVQSKEVSNEIQTTQGPSWPETQ